jgi:CheY-like chemotaxis protein
MRQRSVLLVTYLPDERQLYEEALRGAGFAVTVSDDPLGALEGAIADPPDALVTRIPQPGLPIDGIELTRRIRSHPQTRGSAVVIITSLIDPSYREAAVEAGCDEYIMLPCLPNALVSKVADLLSRPRRRVQPAQSLRSSG